MKRKTENYKFYILGLFIIQAFVLALSQLLFKNSFNVLAAIFTIVDALAAAFLIVSYESDKKERIMTVSRILGTDAKEAMVYGQLGLIIYNDEYEITWASELFDQRKLSMIGGKVTKVIPGSEVLFNGGADKAVLTLQDRRYEIVRSDSSQVLYLKDVTELADLRETYNNEKIVLGLMHLDNYDETVQYEDEQKIALINTNIRHHTVEWAKSYGAVVRRLRSDSLLVVINEANFNKMLESRFSILEEVKNEADKLEVAITASMAFGYGTSDFNELDSMINDLLELVQSRGGDQVAVRCFGQDVRFYGSSSEASEKTSKVRARVMAHSLRDIIRDSDMVFVVPHSDADFDAIGSCMGIGRMVQSYEKASYLVLKDIPVEASAREVIEKNITELVSAHSLVSEEEALQMMTRNSVVIVCDHHSLDLTSAPKLVSEARKTVIIDHHRRKTDTKIEAMMIYNEPSSSSAVELVSEMIQYQQNHVELSDFEATFMYAGILVDTDGFKSRCSSRSFEVCAFLRKQGADISLANEWLKEPLEQFEIKTRILKNSEIVNGNIVVAAMPESEGRVSRTTVAQVANYALTIKNIDAAFVIARIEDDFIACSGRSNGSVNVQIILEKLGGGGHFAAAGLQRKETTVKALSDELHVAINYYLKGEKENESNTVS